MLKFLGDISFEERKKERRKRRKETGSETRSKGKALCARGELGTLSRDK